MRHRRALERSFERLSPKRQQSHKFKTSIGGAIGPELVTNGTFDTDTTGWAEGRGNGTLSNESGRLRATSTAGLDTAPSHAVTLAVGARYRVSAFLDEGTLGGNGVTLRFATNAALSANVTNIQTVTSGTATVTGHFIATHASMFIGAVGDATGADEYFEMDNVSCRLV